MNKIAEEKKKVKEEDKIPEPPEEEKKKGYYVGEVVSQTAPAILNDETDEVLNPDLALAKILNDLKEIKKALL